MARITLFLLTAMTVVLPGTGRAEARGGTPAPYFRAGGGSSEKFSMGFPKGRTIDDNDLTLESTIGLAKNYGAPALDDALFGRAVKTPETAPSGFMVKYADN